MSELVFSLLTTGTAAYHDMTALRIRVLLDPINIPRSYIDPQKEAGDFLIGAYNGKEMAGCCILTELDKTTVQLRQMAVDVSRQRKGIGKALILFAENLACGKGYTSIVLHARENVIPFYERCGYTTYGGPFFEVGIKHCKMHKKMAEFRGAETTGDDGG